MNFYYPNICRAYPIVINGEESDEYCVEAYEMGLADVFCSSDEVESLVAFLRAAAVTVDFWGAYL